MVIVAGGLAACAAGGYPPPVTTSCPRTSASTAARPDHLMPVDRRVKAAVIGASQRLMRSPRADRPRSRRAVARPRRPAARELAERHPGHLVHLDVGVAQLAAGGLEQVVVHGLVDAPVVGDEPVVDGAERRQHPAPDAGLLLDLADRGVLSRLAGLEVALRQRPQQPAPPVEPADQRHARAAGRAVDHQAAGGGLLDRRRPRRSGPPRRLRDRREAGGGDICRW